MKLLTTLPRLFLPAITCATLSLGLSTLADAHEVWIEQNAEGKMVVRFAEYGEDYEKSPGHLDGLFPVVAWSQGEDAKPKFFEAQKKEDGYLLFDAAASSPVFVESGYIVMKRGEGPARKPFFYARWHQPSFGAGTPALNFDIVPTGAAGEVQVFFRGKPLSEAVITVISPDKKESELKADKDGKATFTPTASGNYLLYGKHQREDIAGIAVGTSYESVSHNCTLIWKQP